eukprot:5749631-Pyramimonas_sp.AAC.1
MVRGSGDHSSRPKISQAGTNQTQEVRGYSHNDTNQTCYTLHGTVPRGTSLGSVARVGFFVKAGFEVKGAGSYPSHWLALVSGARRPLVTSASMARVGHAHH